MKPWLWTMYFSPYLCTGISNEQIVSIKVLVYAKKDQMLDLILFVQFKLRISMYVNYVKNDFVVFFRQDKDIIGSH